MRTSVAPTERQHLQHSAIHIIVINQIVDAWVKAGEFKNVHLSRTPGLAEFPDCVAARSTKHLRELEAMVAAGDRAVALFVVQRMDCEIFAPAPDCDPAFAAALSRVADAGVEVLVYGCALTTERIAITRKIDWRR